MLMDSRCIGIFDQYIGINKGVRHVPKFRL